MPSTQTATDTQTARRAAYRNLLDEHGIDLATDGDAREWLDGRDLGRFAIVTQAREYTYATPSAETLAEATTAATQWATDACFAEGPLAVVDLDTGATYVPAWQRLPWEQQR